MRLLALLGFRVAASVALIAAALWLNTVLPSAIPLAGLVYVLAIAVACRLYTEAVYRDNR